VTILRQRDVKESEIPQRLEQVLCAPGAGSRGASAFFFKRLEIVLRRGTHTHTHTYTQKAGRQSRTHTQTHHTHTDTNAHTAFFDSAKACASVRYLCTTASSKVPAFSPPPVSAYSRTYIDMRSKRLAVEYPQTHMRSKRLAVEYPQAHIGSTELKHVAALAKRMP
jgi:hypothetical protein